MKKFSEEKSKIIEDKKKDTGNKEKSNNSTKWF